MYKIRFIKEIDGKLFVITNYRILNGIIQFSNGKCWKFPYKKRAV